MSCFIIFARLSIKVPLKHRMNFRPLRIKPGFSVECYAIGVSNELLWALEGLIEE